MGLVAVRGRCGASAAPLFTTLTLALAVTHAVPLAAATRNVPADYPSVQAAVDAASSGDIILLAPGTHQGGVFVNGKALRFTSRYHTTGDTSYIAQTVISGVAADMCAGRSDCQGGAVIEFGPNAHGSAIVGLTITDGTDGVRSRSMADILYCRIIGTGDGTDYSGSAGGLFSNSLFANNRDDGIDLNGRVDVRIINNIVRDNRDDGIEFRIQQYAGAVITTEITGNRITGNGEDGIQIIDYPDNSSRILHIDRNYFSNNADAAVGIMGNGNTVEDLSGAPMPERVRLYNNTFSAERNGFVGGANVIALNNIFTGVQASALRRVGGSSIASYNLFWNNGTDSEDSNVDQAHAVIANPLLTSSGTLGSGSPAIDTGTAFFQWQGQTVLNMPASSYSGNAPDLGAFESSGSTPSPLFISCAPPVTISCPAVPSFPTPTVSGACGSPNLTYVDTTTPGTCPGRSTVTRNWTVTDACGRSATCSQTITVRDNTAPVFSGVGPPWTIECGTSPVFSEPTASDACDPTPTVTFVDVTTPGACPQSRVVTRTWTARDDCGNIATASQIITIQDRTAPTLLASPANVTVSCPTVPEFGQPSFSDACDNSVTVTFADETLPATCPVVSVVRRTWTAADDCGNSVRTSQTLTVRDQTPPAITGVDGPLVLECPATPQFGTPTLTDDCSGSPQLTWNDVTAPGACASEYAVTRTWIATDACGNTATATRTITIRDRAPPAVVSSPADVTLSCPATPAFGTPVFSDACDSTPAMTFADQELPANGSEVRRVMRTWTATDDCGNSATTSQTVTIEDLQPPVLGTAGGSATLECPASLQFTSPAATDACDSQPVVTFSDVTTPGACSQEYSVTRTWTATDAAGNRSASVSQTLTVRDRTAPTITGVGAEGVIEGPATPQFGTPVALDACDPNPVLTHVDVTSPGACAGEYTVTRTWTATDACGNTSVPVSRSLRVEDTAPPALQVGSAITVQCPSTPVFDPPVVTDAVDPSPNLTFVDVTQPGSCAQSYTVTRTWTATDACGNSSTASQAITVEDRTAPVWSGGAGPRVLEAPATPAFDTPTADDGCDPAPVVSFADVTTPGSCPQSYTVTRTWTATDACGNTSTTSQAVTVEDRTAPVLAGVEAPRVIECPEEPAFSAPSATDGADPHPRVTFADVTTAGSCARAYSVTRTWTATDACGNSSSESQTITVEDRTAPVIEGVFEALTFESPAVQSFSTPAVHDACDPSPSLTYSDVAEPGPCPQALRVVRTWIATDACGNTSVPVSQVVQVEDRTAPLISGVEGPATLECPATLEFGQPTASDAGDPNPGLTFVDVTTPGGCAQSFTVTRTWTATDACGNSSTASRSLTVEDRTPPVLSGTGTSHTLACPAVPAFETPTASDACDPAPVVTFVDVTGAGPCPQATSVTRTWTATDACGNSSTASTTITMEDRTPPQISGIEPGVLIRCPVTPAYAFPTVQDDCDPAPVVTFSDVGSSGVCPEGFSLTRTWVATDACGNSSSASQTLTVLADSTIGNLVGNPSFETDTEGWRGYGAPTLERVPGNLDGDYVLRIEGPNSTGRFGIIDQPRWVAVPAAGTRYRMSAWVRSDHDRGTMRIQVREYLEDSREGMVYSDPLKLTSQWQLLTVDYVAASTGSKLDFMILNYPDRRSEQFLVDDISIHTASGGFAADVSAPELSRVGSADSTAIGVTLYPTPFRSRGTLRFATATRGPLSVEILDVSGRRVRRLLDTPDAEPGVHRLPFDGRGDGGQPLAPGVYFYRIQASAQVTRGRFIIIQ